MALQLSATNFSRGPGAGLVDGARDQFLAGAGLAEDQDGAVGRRHRLDDLEHLLHRGTPAHQLRETIPFPKLLAQIRVLRLQPLALDGPTKRQVQLGELERLGHEVGCPLPNRIHGRPDGSVARDDNHQDVRVSGAGRVEHRRALTVGQPQVREHHVEGKPLELLQRLGDGRRLGHREAGAGQVLRNPAPECALVIDQQQGAGGLTHGRQYIDTPSRRASESVGITRFGVQARTSTRCATGAAAPASARRARGASRLLQGRRHRPDTTSRYPPVMTDLGPLAELFHRLNNHLGIVLVNAELIEARCPDAGTRTRAADVVQAAVSALDAVKEIRRQLPEGLLDSR